VLEKLRRAQGNISHDELAQRLRASPKARPASVRFQRPLRYSDNSSALERYAAMWGFVASPTGPTKADGAGTEKEKEALPLTVQLMYLTQKELQTNQRLRAASRRARNMRVGPYIYFLPPPFSRWTYTVHVHARSGLWCFASRATPTRAAPAQPSTASAPPP
jgi:hypothetical protein